METERRRQLLLAALVVVLAVLAYRMWPAPSAPAVPASNERGSVRTARTTAPAPSTIDVHLQALSAERAKPVSAERDLFRFKPKAAPPPPPRLTQPPPVAPVPTGPPPPPPLPPIPYKFVGLVEVPGQSKRIAVLSDGRSAPVFGREGDIIEGRYRIVQIGAESIEMEYLDGRGRQRIRLSGS